MNFSWLLLFAIFTLIISSLYLYMFLWKQEKFMQLWGISWIAYICSLICLLLYFISYRGFFLELRKLIDMMNLLFLLFGTYSFMHVKIPTYWYRFSLYMLLLAAICMIYNFYLLSFYLPISIYQITITIFICYNILKKWELPKTERYLSSLIFLTWGVVKSLFSIVEIVTDMQFNLYITELMLFIMVNLCIFTIYIAYIKRANHLEDDLYQTIMENSRDVIFYYKLEPYRAFQYISPSMEALTGFSPAVFYNDPGFYRNMATEKQLDEIEDIFQPRPPYKEIHVLELTKRSGETFWGEFNCAVINDEEDRPLAIEGTLRDVTEAKSAELEQYNATKSRNMLLSYISHELRTPITSIAGFLTAISDGTMSSQEEKDEAMEIITGKTLTLKKLIDDLDQLTKLETNQFTFDFTSCTTAEMTEFMLNNNLSDIKSAGFDVTIDCDLRILEKHWIVADLDRVNQVFSNLATNAIKYSGSKKYIETSFGIDDNQENFVVSVKDHGIGIKDIHISHIFDRFYRAEHSGPELQGIEGRGLGLTLCKEIIAAHQGAIYAESVYGSGSVFTFIIPLFKEA